MATWDSKTDDERAKVQAVANPGRALAGEFASLLNRAKDIGLAYSGDVEAILATVDGTEMIPNATGLADARPISRELLVNLIGYYIIMGATADGAAGSYNTPYHRSIYIAAAGINAIIT